MQLPADLAHCGSDRYWAPLRPCQVGRNSPGTERCQESRLHGRNDLQWTRHLWTKHSESEIPASQSVHVLHTRQHSVGRCDASARACILCKQRMSPATNCNGPKQDSMPRTLEPRIRVSRRLWVFQGSSASEAFYQPPRKRGRGRHTGYSALYRVVMSARDSGPPAFPTFGPSSALRPIVGIVTAVRQGNLTLAKRIEKKR